MYLTLENIKNNVCKRSTKSFKKVKDLVNGTTEKLSLQQVLQIIDTPEVSTRDLIYQMRSFSGENVKQFFVEFAILRAERVLHMYEAAYPENLCARNAIQAAKNWVDNPTEATADAAAAAYAAYAAAYAAAAAAAYAAAAADAADASARRDLRKLVIKYYDTDRRNNKLRNAVCQGIRRRVLDQWVEKLEKTSLKHESARLINGEPVEVGYRSSCGVTDQTMKDFDLFRKFLKALKAQGVSISETPVSHKNAYATNNGGFWNSYIFKIAKQ